MREQVRQDVTAPHIGQIAEFMLKATGDEDEEVALEACEFWPEVSVQAPTAAHTPPLDAGVAL